MVFLIAVLLFLPISAAWVAVTLGMKIRDNSTHRNVGLILIWTPFFCCAWILLSIVVIFNAASYPESFLEKMLSGNWLEAVVIGPVFFSAVATIGAAAFAISERLYSVHAFMTILLCIPVIRLFFVWSAELFG